MSVNGSCSNLEVGRLIRERKWLHIVRHSDSAY